MIRTIDDPGFRLGLRAIAHNVGMTKAVLTNLEQVVGSILEDSTSIESRRELLELPARLAAAQAALDDACQVATEMGFRFPDPG